MGRELPPDEVLGVRPADQRAGGGAAQGRARGRHGRAACPRLPRSAARQGLPAPRPPGRGTTDTAGQDGGTEQQPPGAGPAGGAAGGGFAGQVTLTVPLGTAAGRADRPGELAGHGPVDPWLARDLIRAAARNPKTTWCVTVTDQHGHAVGHGCARPEPTSHRTTRRTRPAGRGRVQLHPGQPGRPARRIRHLAAAHPGTRAGPDRRDRHPGHPQLPAHLPGPGPRPRGQAPAPVPGPARNLHQPRLPAPRRPVRLRAQHPLRGRRANVPVLMGGRSAGMTTGSSSSPDGPSTSSPTAPSGGPPQPGAATTPNPPGTPSSGPRTRPRRCAGRCTGTGWRRRRTPSVAGTTAIPSSGWSSQPASPPGRAAIARYHGT